MIITSLKTRVYTIISLLFLVHVHSISFRKSRFVGTDPDIILEGGAYASVGSIEFNSATYICQVGSATYAADIPLWDASTQTVSELATHFTFFLDNNGRNTSTAGLTFFLAPAGYHIPPNSACGFLGLYNLTTKDSLANQIVHVEFDTLVDPEWDPEYKHVGINSKSIKSAVYTAWNSTLHDQDDINVWISYDPGRKNLSVSWRHDSSTSPKENSSLSYIVDLKEVLPEWITVGFTGSTASFTERHVLTFWEFSSSLERNEDTGKNSKELKIVVGVVIPVVVLLAVVAIVFGVLWRRKYLKKKATEAASMTLITDDFVKEAGPRKFSYKELASATNNFSSERKLGEGGFGAVYGGNLKDLGMEVAVKRVSKGSKQGKKEFVTEVTVISQLRHRNLVQLMGWCHDKGEFMLVYEYMPNGSLDSHLYGKNPPLAWDCRYRIALGLASALLYLHEEGEQCVVHRDIKSSNIMLDSSFNAKLGDFGLARFMNHELGIRTTVLAGTFGYLAPEYVYTGRASKESDVYSFGIVVLEIVTGRKVADKFTEDSEMSLLEWVWDLYGAGNLELAIDRKLRMDVDDRQAECLMIVGLWCAHPYHALRASIKQAIHVLNFEAPLPDLPKTMPVLFHEMTPVSVVEPLMPSSSVESGR